MESSGARPKAIEFGSPGVASAEHLRALIEAERECCRELLPVVDREMQATASRALDRLVAAGREREQIQARWTRLAERRRRVVAALGAPLVELARRDAALADTLRQLERDATQLRRGQRIAEAVIRGALRNATDLLTAIRQRMPDSRYDARAAVRTGLLGGASRAWSV